MRQHIGVYFRKCEKSEKRGGEIGTKVCKLLIRRDLTPKTFFRKRPAKKVIKLYKVYEESATYRRSFFANRLRKKIQEGYPFETLQVLNKVSCFSRCEKSPSRNCIVLLCLWTQEGLFSLFSLFSQLPISGPLSPLPIFASLSPLPGSPDTRARICCCRYYSFEREREREGLGGREHVQSWKANKRRRITRSALCLSI